MKERCAIIITGMPATGKTTNGIKIAQQLKLEICRKVSKYCNR